MRRFHMPVIILLLLSGCDHSARDEAAEPEVISKPEVVEEIRTFSGADAYELACASCHEEGLNGAPKTGDPDAWAQRSWLWEAVLFEHAKKGYNDMPPKGGYESLDDDLVEKAADYMLRQTHRAPPPD